MAQYFGSHDLKLCTDIHQVEKTRSYNTNFSLKLELTLRVPHIVPCGKFHKIGGAPPETSPSEKYDAPEEVGGDRKCFDSPIRK